MEAGAATMRPQSAASSGAWRAVLREFKAAHFWGNPAVALKDARERREEAKGLLARESTRQHRNEPPSRNRLRPSGTALKTSLSRGIGHVSPDFRQKNREQPYIA